MVENMALSICIVVFTILTTFGNCENYDEEAWKEAADFLNQGYNSSAIPCDDFTQFACGKWLRETGKEKVSQFYAHHGILYSHLAESILSINEDDETTPLYKVWVKTFFEHCLNHTDLENRNDTIRELFTNLVNILGMPPILNSYKKTKADPLKRNIWNFLGYLQREIPVVKVFFSASIESIATDCNGYKPVLQLRSQTWNEEQLNPKAVAKYTKLLAHLLDLELDEKEMKKKIDNMVEFENELISFFNVTEEAAAVRSNSQSQAESGKEITLENAVTISDLEQFNPNISWSEYFRGLFSKEQYSNWNQSEPLILVDDVQFFELLDDVTVKFDTETIFNYIFYKSIVKFFGLISSDYGSTSEFKCSRMTVDLFKSASSKILFDHLKYDAFEWRHDIQLLAETVFSAFKFLVIGSDWLDAEDKVVIIDKVNQISFFPGVPDWFKNDSEIEHRTIEVKPNATTVENYFRLKKRTFDRDLDYVIGLDDINVEDEPELDVNAFYSSMYIVMKLGYAFPPWYHPKYPLSVKYGNLGYVLGHELLHSFDAVRVQEIPTGAKKWLKKETLETFNRKRDCLIKQYSSYCFKAQQLCLSGRKTITENMADIDGLKIAYMAYKFAAQTIGEEPPLPGFLDLTGDQLFFLTNARTRCSTGGDVKISLDVENEPHTPDQARIDIPFRNFPVFAKLFGCSVGSVYAPVKTCSMWGSYNAGSKFN